MRSEAPLMHLRVLGELGRRVDEAGQPHDLRDAVELAEAAFAWARMLSARQAGGGAALRRPSCRRRAGPVAMLPSAALEICPDMNRRLPARQEGT